MQQQPFQNLATLRQSLSSSSLASSYLKGSTMALKMTNEQFQEEFNKLDEELKHLQHELADTLTMNDEFVKSVEDKELELAKKDARLALLREKNLAELEQLELEKEATKENYKHDITLHLNILENLKTQQDRFLKLEQENIELAESVRYLHEVNNQDHMNHALANHLTNKSMKELRQQMEAKLRKELNGMNISYQKDAFSALLDSQKQAMFENAKLKDEVALQGVGIVNLGTRLARQKQQTAHCQKELAHLSRKAKVLREKLSERTFTRNQQQKERVRLSAEYDQLSREKESLHDVLNVSPLIAQIQCDLRDAIQNVSSEDIELDMWTERLRLLQALFAEIKPTSSAEKEGHFSSQAFTLIPPNLGKESGSLLTPAALLAVQEEPVPGMREAFDLKEGREFTDSAAQQQDQESSVAQSVTSQSVKHSQLEALMGKDAMLAKALQPLKGKEALLIGKADGKDSKHHSSTHTTSHTSTSNRSTFSSQLEDDQNMVQWITLQIVNIWLHTEQAARAITTSGTRLQRLSGVSRLSREAPPAYVERNKSPNPFLISTPRTPRTPRSRSNTKEDATATRTRSRSRSAADETSPAVVARTRSRSEATESSPATVNATDLKNNIASQQQIHRTASGAEDDNTSIIGRTHSLSVTSEDVLSAVGVNRVRSVTIDDTPLTSLPINKPGDESAVSAKRKSSLRSSGSAKYGSPVPNQQQQQQRDMHNFSPISFTEESPAAASATAATTSVPVRKMSKSQPLRPQPQYSASQFTAEMYEEMHRRPSLAVSVPQQTGSTAEHGSLMYTAEFTAEEDFEEGNLSELEIERLWDDCFSLENTPQFNHPFVGSGKDSCGKRTTGTAGDHTAANALHWFKKVPEPKRFPDCDYHITGKTGKTPPRRDQKGGFMSKNDFAARLQSNNDIGPPILSSSLNMSSSSGGINGSGNKGSTVYSAVGNKLSQSIQSGIRLDASLNRQSGAGAGGGSDDKSVHSSGVQSTGLHSLRSGASQPSQLSQLSHSSLRFPPLDSIAHIADPLLGRSAAVTIKRGGKIKPLGASKSSGTLLRNSKHLAPVEYNTGGGVSGPGGSNGALTQQLPSPASHSDSLLQRNNRGAFSTSQL